LKPVVIDPEDSLEKIREKLNILADDVYSKFSSINSKIIDFVSEEPIPQQVVVSVDSDQSDVDVTAHESTYNHLLLHTRLHDIDSTSDHSSTITEDNIITADANGLPKDSTVSVADVEDCDNHSSGSTNFVLIKQTAEADLNQTISNPPTQTEVQDISDKIDALLAKLRSANVLAT